MRIAFLNLTAVVAMLCFSAPLKAQDLIGSYVAYIGAADLANSKGKRLTEPWQILRQDRANVHKFGISQEGDEWDPFFGNASNRAIMELMIMKGAIDGDAKRKLLLGGAMVFVRIYGKGSRGDYVKVTVTR